MKYNEIVYFKGKMVYVKNRFIFKPKTIKKKINYDRSKAMINLLGQQVEDDLKEAIKEFSKSI